MKNPNVRRPNETQEKYKARRNAEAKAEKQRTKGVNVWNSKRKGTYVRAKHGELV